MSAVRRSGVGRRIKRKRAARRASPSEVELTRYKAAVEGSEEGVWDWLVKTGEVVFSDGWKTMLGYEPNEIENSLTEWESRVHPDDLATATRDVNRHIAGLTSHYRNEHRMLHKSGRWIWILDRGRVIERDEKGEAVRFIGTHQDISPQKELESNLRLAQDRFHEAEEVALLGHWEYDVLAQSIHWSPQVFRLFGLDVNGPEPDLEKHLGEQVHPEDAPRFKETVFAALTQGRSYEFEYRGILPNGESRWLMGRGRCRTDRDGRVVGLCGTVQDIHARKLAQLALADANRDLVALAKKADQANLAKSSFLATMSHEIRTPLNGVLGMASMLATTELSVEQREFTETIRKSGDSLLVLLNDILDLSKIESGQLELHPKPLDVDQAIADSLQLFSGKAAEKGIFLRFESTRTSPLHVLIDGGRLRQILLNLVGNAVKFTHTGGVTIRLVAEERTVSEGHDVHFSIEVSDTGIGIATTSLEKLFQPFSQGDANIGQSYGGTGLGLAISKRLAESLNGSLAVTSELARGSRFVFSCVATSVVGTAQAASERIVLPSPTSGQRLRVLVAEDNSVNQRVAEKLLGTLGCDVVLASDGLEALERAREQQFDLIIMDCQMPKMDGFEATRRLRELSAHYRTVPIVALTANAFEEDKDRCLAAGMNQHHSKPVSRETFERIVLGVRLA